MKRKILVFALLLSLITTLIPIAISTPLTTSAAPPDTGWTLVTDARALKGYPNLDEYIWQKNASMAPNGLYDKIGLHRLVQTGIASKGVVFINPGTYGSGESLISNPTTDNYTKIENESQAIYWANRGFDVYAIDYRTHFVPATLNTSQLGFMANWGWDQWISDIKEAMNKAKDTSGVSSVFMAGQSFGGRASMNYATVYSQDIKGIILLDGGNAAANPNTTNSYNLTAALAQENATANWALIAPNLPGRTPIAPTFQALMQYALANPSAPAEAPPGTPLPPSINPMTNRSWSNITEWSAFVLSGATSNILGGYSNVSTVIRTLAEMDRYWPDRLNLEQNAFSDWNNCPYVTYDFDDHYKSVNVPLIGFTSELFGLDRYGLIGNITNPDVTRIFLKGYGHIDVFSGTFSARDVSEPVYQWMVNHTPSGWTIVTDARAMKAYPDLKEYVWQKNATMPPNGQYDIIGLHRLVKTGVTPKGVIFICPGTYCNGAEQIISNPSTNNFTMTEEYSEPMYWANRGYDVYAIDYRTHFVPTTVKPNETAFMANWGYDQWISDTKEAVDKTKEVSGASKIFIAGESFGGSVAMFYASKYWQQDLSGIILLDGGSPIKATTTNSYNLTAQLNQMQTSRNYSLETPNIGLGSSPSGTLFLYQYALQNPGGPAVWITGTPLPPTINPLTNKTWANITEWLSVIASPNSTSNVAGGIGNLTTYIHWIATMDRYWPLRLSYELAAISDWTNCPYTSYDYDDHYKEINIPLLSFQSELFGKTYWGNVTNGVATTDFTSILLLGYGHIDVYSGTYCAIDVSQPTLEWMNNHLPGAFTLGNTNIGTFQDGNDGQAKSASYFMCNYTGTLTNIFAYVARLGEAGDGAAAIYADNGGSPGALIAATDEATVGTDFSWVDFPFLSPVNVTAGTGYWLAISSNNDLNMKIVVGSGVRVHNGVSSWFSDPFGSVWGTHDAGSMSIYAKGTGK